MAPKQDNVKGSCQCCVCRWIACNVNHPSHDHRAKKSLQSIKKFASGLQLEDDEWDAMKDPYLVAFMEQKP